MPPMPKRSDQRHGHRTKAEQATVEKAPAGAEVQWHASSRSWDPIAKRFYNGLQVSGQSVYYEQSDADLAFFVAEAMSRNLQQGRFSGQLFSAVMSSMGDLLVTEGSRRRAKLELQRAMDAPDTEVDDAIRDLMTQFNTKDTPATE